MPKKHFRCKAGDTCLFPHYKVDEQPNKKKQKKSNIPKRRESDDKNAVAILKSVSKLGCASQDSDALVSQGRKSRGNPMQKVLEPNKKSSIHEVHATSREHPECLVIPLRAMAEYHPISAEDLSRLHQFGPKVLPGVLLGYAVHAGGTWKGDITVAEIEEFEKMDASEIHAKRLNAKEVLTPMSGEKFIFPIADGTVKFSGGDQDLRTSTLIRDRPDRGEEQGNVQKRIRRIYFKTHRCMMVKLEMISGLCQAILFTVITLHQESNCACRERHHSLFH